MVHGVLLDEGQEFFIQPSYARPDTQPDGTPWDDENISYYEWLSAFQVSLHAVLQSLGQQ